MGIKAPFYSYQQLVAAADDCNRTHNPKLIIPVPIEDIVDRGFRIDIVPEYGLEDRFQAVAFITKDLTEIPGRPTRLRAATGPPPL